MLKSVFWHRAVKQIGISGTEVLLVNNSVIMRWAPVHEAVQMMVPQSMRQQIIYFLPYLPSGEAARTTTHVSHLAWVLILPKHCK